MSASAVVGAALATALLGSACSSSSTVGRGATGGTSGSSTGGGATSSSGPSTVPSVSNTSNASTPESFSYPVAVSPNHRFLVDQHGQPFLIVGDSPQCLSANLSIDDMEYFFSNRQAHGFNSAWVNLLCGSYTRGREDASTYDGIKPFLKDGDLSSPNPDYFTRMDTMVSLAAHHGITLLLDPAETGSFRGLLKNNGMDKSHAYGLFLGERYKDDRNIIWMFGNDYQQDQWSEYDPYLTALARGIRSVDPAKLQTIELNYNMSTSYDDGTWPPLIDLAAAYTYFPTYDAVLKAYNSKPTLPVFMVEANYEFENNQPGPDTTDETLRRQEYWTMLSGATGQLYGNGYTWGLNDKKWKEHFDTNAVAELGFMTKLFTSGPWQELVPDQDHRFLTEGTGRPSSSGDVLDNDYATAALTTDGSFAMIYAPTERKLVVDQSKLRAGTSARWFDPTSGRFQPAAVPFETPGKNSAGDHDWVLVFGPAS